MIDSLRQRNWRDWARKDLGRYSQAQKNIEHFQEKFYRLREKSKRLSPPLSADKVQVQSADNGPEDLLCILADMGDAYRKLQIKSEMICREIELRIGELDNEQQQRILRDYWLYDQTLKEISVMEAISYDYAKELHGQALENYGERFFQNPPQPTL